MKTIVVKNYGDFWVNQKEVENETAKLDPTESVLFNVWEGISLNASGLSAWIQNWQDRTGRTTDQIQISCVNHQDSIPWHNVHPEVSSCWVMAKNYWTDDVQFVTEPSRIGLFVSRRSIARNVIMYDCAKIWPDHFLLSRTQHNVPEPWNDHREDFNSWCNANQQAEIKQWYANCPVTSIDKIWHQDQFDSNKNTNASLLQHYHKFSIELCLETMTQGGSFFPTEKIVRPMVGLKPFVVYGARNYLANLQRLGFQTFGDVWDESYDQLEGPERWQGMRQTIDYILNNPEVVVGCADVVKYNKEHLKQLLF